MHPLGLPLNRPFLTKQQWRRVQIRFLQAVLQEIVGGFGAADCVVMKLKTSPFN